MGQAEILRELEETQKKLKKQIKKLIDHDKKLDFLWEEALDKKQLIDLLGISLKAVTVNLSKLIKKEEIVMLQNETDKRQRKYVRNESDIIRLVNDGTIKHINIQGPCKKKSE